PLMLAAALRRGRAEQQAGGRGDGHEELQHYQAALRPRAGERSAAEVRAQDGDDVGDDRGAGGSRRTQAQGGPDQERKDDVLDGLDARRSEEGGRARGEQPGKQQRAFGDRAAAARYRLAVRPHQQRGGDDQSAERVAEPPDPPQFRQRGGGL